MVHALIDMRNGTRKTRCGLVLEPGKGSKLAKGWVEETKTTAWESEVSCSKCKQPKK